MMTKVRFKLPDDSVHQSETEGIWVEYLGDNKYRISNIPFYVYGVSYDDIVEAEEQDGQLFYAKTVSKSGNNTFRLIIEKGVSEETFKEYVKNHLLPYATYEKGLYNLYSFNVDYGIDVKAFVRELDRGEALGLFEYEDGDYNREENVE